jgi:beta-galactosidase
MERVVLQANQNWRFFRGAPPTGRRDPVSKSAAKNPWDSDYDDSLWELVTLPHTVRTEPLMASGCTNYQGEAWYRRRFTLPEELAGRDLLFEFEAAMQRADAWLDGEPLGFAEGGFLPVAFDLSGKIAPEREHTIAVRVDNSNMADVPPGKPQGALDFSYFGGLYRDAHLYAAGKLRFSNAVHEGKPASGGLYVTYPKVNAEEAVVRAKVHILNHTGKTVRGNIIRVELENADGIVKDESPFDVETGSDAELIIDLVVKKPRLWHPYHPDLYRITAYIFSGDGEKLDEISERIGIRTIRFAPDGFYINGEKIFLSGANRHQEYAYTGFALPDSLQRRDAALLRKAGMILIRTAHYPQDRAFMDACDELGMLCIIPTPGWQIHPASVKFDLASYENTRRLIRYNRNHPSAALWEPILNETDYPEYFARRQLEIVREETADENIWCACDGHYAYSDRYPVNYSFMAAASGKPYVIREYGDNYTEQFGPMGTLRRVRRGGHTGFYLGGERAMIRSAQEHFENYYIIRSLPGLSGASMWAGIDHNRGYEDNEAAVGMLDFLRLPKFSYYIYEAQQDISQAGPKCFIANYWTADSPRDVTVYTNAQAVRLLLNGREIGVLSVKEGWEYTEIFFNKTLMRHKIDITVTHENIPEGVHPPLTFKNVPFEPGELRAEALVEGGRIAASYTVRTPGPPKKISLAPQWAGTNEWVADGSDLLMVHVSAVDANGTTVPDFENETRFSVKGCAEIVGDGEGWTHANPARLEAGASGVLLRAGKEAGAVILRAETEGLEPAEIVLNTTPYRANLLASPELTAPVKKPEYPCDQKKRFSPLIQLRFEPWYRFNLATGKEASASSSAPGYPPGNAVTGKIAEPWMAADSSSPQWWQCDLGEAKQIFGTTIFWQDDGLWYDYTVQVSDDGKAWDTLASGRSSGQSHVPDYFASPANKRYLRVNVEGVSGNRPAGIYLVELHGRSE